MATPVEHAPKVSTSVIAAIVSLALTSHTSSSEAQIVERAPIRVAVSHGIEGALAEFSCTDGDQRQLLSDRASRILSANNDGFVAIDSGSLLGFATTTQLAITFDRAAFAQAISDSGWHALVVGRRDIAAPRATFVRAAEALRDANVPMVFSNLRCSAPAMEVCDAILDATDAPPLITIQGQVVAIVSAIHPSALAHVASDRSAGLQLEAPDAAIIRATAEARSRGATHVIAVYEPRRDDPVADALELSRLIPVESAPDVLLVNDVSPILRQALSGDHSRMQILATPRSGVNRFVIQPDRVTTPRASTVPPPASLGSFQSAFAQSVCAHESIALRGGLLEVPLNARAMTELLGDVVRHYERADVAVINYGVVDRRHYVPLRGSIRRLDVLLALPLDNTLRQARVTGAVLRKAFAAAAQDRFMFRGMTRDGDDLLVNGRAVEDDSEYTIAATDFVVDMHVLPESTVWTPFGTRTAREALLGYLNIPRTFDPRRTADDLTHMTRWLFSLGVSGTLTNVNLNNPATDILTDAQLSRSEALSAQMSIDARANANHPDYTFENTLTARYGIARTLSASMMMMGTTAPAISETADLISLRSIFAFRGLQTQSKRWYVPAPYVEVYAESEFTRPDTRMYHHLELRPTGGARFAVADRFSVFFGYGASAELLADRSQLPPGQSNILSTFQLGWVLQPGKFFSVGDREIQWDSTLDLAIRDVFRFPGLQVRAHAGLRVPLIGPLSLTVAYDLFLRYLALEDSGDGRTSALGYAGDLEIGLGVNLARGVQTFVR